MASRNEHSGGSKPGPSWASGSSTETERKTAQQGSQSSDQKAFPRVIQCTSSSFVCIETCGPEYGRTVIQQERDERKARIDQLNERIGRRMEEENMKKRKEAEDKHLQFQEDYSKLLTAMPLSQNEEGIKQEQMDVDEPSSKTTIKIEADCEVDEQENKIKKEEEDEATATTRRSRSSGKHHKMPNGSSTKDPPPRVYKVMYDGSFMTQLKTKDFVRRYNGKCGEKYKQFDYPQAPMDPRSKFRRVDQPKNLIVPNLVVDDQYIGIPPKREVTISNLNDNVNKEFLLKMTRSQKLEPQDVQVFFHPLTKKHMEMAHILFVKSKHASMFVEANNGVSVMGKQISCKLDPFAADLSALYAPLAGSPLPSLPYLSGMSEHELSLRRERIIGTICSIPQVEGATVIAAPVDDGEMTRSLSPMDTSNSPLPEYETLPPHFPQPSFEPEIQPQQTYVDSFDASTSKHVTPPPPYSELPPTNHGMYEERRSDSRKRMGESEEKIRRDKRRRESTSSSSSYSSGGEFEEHSNGTRRRSDGGVKKKREEYLKVQRFVSSERDSNGDKIIRKEVKTVTYKRRTEQRTTIDQKKVSPDSFDEEMKRRERSMSRGARNSERGRDEMRWSSPSSDSDNGSGAGGGRRKRAKDRASESQSREDERYPPPPADPIPSTPSSTTSSVPSSRRSGRSGFHSAPIFDPTQPPPLVVPPVGLVLPDCSLPPLPPPIIPMTPMMAPPPPLPGGFIPPPEAFGIHMTPAMMLSAMTFGSAAGMTPLPPGLPPPIPPMIGVPIGAGYGGTPLPHQHYPSPARPAKMPHKVEETASASASVSSPSSLGMHRASSSSSLTASGRTPSDLKTMTTPTTPSEGSTTPQTSATTAAEKKVNLDDRLSQIFGIRKAKKDEEAAREMKHAASAPSFSALDVTEKRAREDDDMEIDDDDDMDVASSSSSFGDGVAMMMERRGGYQRETEDEMRRRAEADRAVKERQAKELTKITVDKLVRDLEQQLIKDLARKLETTSMNTLDKWLKRAQHQEEERKKQMIRDSLAAAAARDAMLVTPKKDPMEEMLAAKLLSPEGLSGRGISKLLSSIPIAKRKNLVPAFSRDGTPTSRDSRAASETKSRSSSRSSTRSASTSSNEMDRRRKKRREKSSSSVDSSSDSDERDEDGDDQVRKAVRRRPNMRNIESSQSSAASTSSSSSSSSSSDSTSETEFGADLDVVGISEDEAEKIKEECASPIVPSSSTGAVEIAIPLAAEDNNQEVKMEEEEGADTVKREEEEEEPKASSSMLSSAPAPPLPSIMTSPLRLSQADLLRQQPSMRPDERGYDPVRYDHPYIRQLGVPFGRPRSVQPTVMQRVSQQMAAATTIARAVAVADKSTAVATGVAPIVSTARQQLYKTKKDAKKASEGERIPHDIRSGVSLVKKIEKREHPKRIFPKRNEVEELWIRDSFKAGMDEEDEVYTQTALSQLQADGARPFGYDGEVPFESRIRAYTPRELPRPARLGKLDLYYDDNELAGIVPHTTGCARAQGFYRLTTKQKIRIMRRPEAYQDRTEINERDEVVSRHQVQAQKEQRSMNRRLQTMVDSNPNSEFFKVNQLKYRKKMIKFARSRIHGWGLYALEPIAPDDMIVEYIGQKIRPIVADEREKAYERRGIGSSYLFRIDEDEVIDATKQGNFARFINHSCQPNCYAKVMTVDGDKRIVIYSKALIQKGDEITYDYKFPIEVDKIECLCGAPQCRGTLN